MCVLGCLIITWNLLWGYFSHFKTELCWRKTKIYLHFYHFSTLSAVGWNPFLAEENAVFITVLHCRLHGYWWNLRRINQVKTVLILTYLDPMVYPGFRLILSGILLLCTGFLIILYYTRCIIAQNICWIFKGITANYALVCTKLIWARWKFGIIR